MSADRVTEEIEKFIRRYYDAEIIISLKAQEIKMETSKIFGDCLANSISSYMQSDEQTRESMKKSCFFFITKAYSYGLISPSERTLGLLTEERKKNADILRDLAICMANYTALQKKHQDLLEILDQNQSGDWKKKEKDENNG